MKSPETYAEWSTLFTALEADDLRDEELLIAAEAGKIVWSSGVAERMTQGLAAVFDARLKRTNLALQRDLNAARGRESSVAAAMLGARRRLAFLARLSALSTLPENVREHFRGELKRFIDRVHTTLEASAMVADPTGRLRQTFRNNPLTPLTPPPKTESATESSGPRATTGRRVLFNSSHA